MQERHQRGDFTDFAPLLETPRNPGDRADDLVLALLAVDQCGSDAARKDD